MLGNKSGDELDIAKRIQDFKVQNAEVESHLKTVEGYFKKVSYQ